MLAFAACSAIF